MNNNIHVLARAVIVSQNHILLAYDPRPHSKHYYEFDRQFYYLPGGHIEFKESAKNALIREIKEETGFDASVERFLGVLENSWHFSGDEICCHTHEVNLIFKSEVLYLQYGDKIEQKEEHVAFDWTCLDNLDDVDLRPIDLRKSLLAWLGFNASSAFCTSVE